MSDDPNRIVLSWPAFRFRSALRAALVAAASDVALPHLSAVQFRRLNGVLTIVATDGTWLFRWKETEGQTDEESETIDRSPFECVVPRRVLESFLAATSKALELERVNLIGSDNRWRLETIMDVCRHEFMHVPEPYPDADKVIPTVVAPSVSSIGVGADMLVSVSKAFALATGEKTTTIFWQFSGNALSPLVCTSPTHEQLLAVVMPRRMEHDENAVPEKAKEAAE